MLRNDRQQELDLELADLYHAITSETATFEATRTHAKKLCDNFAGDHSTPADERLLPKGWQGLRDVAWRPFGDVETDTTARLLHKAFVALTLLGKAGDDLDATEEDELRAAASEAMRNYLDCRGVLSRPVISFYPDALRKKLDCSSGTLRKYALKAGVHTPKHGERDFQYTASDAFKIARQIIAESRDKQQRSKAEQFIADLEKKSQLDRKIAN